MLLVPYSLAPIQLWLMPCCQSVHHKTCVLPTFFNTEYQNIEISVLTINCFMNSSCQGFCYKKPGICEAPWEKQHLTRNIIPWTYKQRKQALDKNWGEEKKLKIMQWSKTWLNISVSFKCHTHKEMARASFMTGSI